MNSLIGINKLIKELHNKDVGSLKDVHIKLFDLRELAFYDSVKTLEYNSDLVLVSKDVLDKLKKDSYTLNYVVDQ